MLSGCKVALTQGLFRRDHDQVLAKVAKELERSRIVTNSTPETAKPTPTVFVMPGSTHLPSFQASLK